MSYIKALAKAEFIRRYNTVFDNFLVAHRGTIQEVDAKGLQQWEEALITNKELYLRVLSHLGEDESSINNSGAIELLAKQRARDAAVAYLNYPLEVNGIIRTQ